MAIHPDSGNKLQSKTAVATTTSAQHPIARPVFIEIAKNVIVIKFPSNIFAKRAYEIDGILKRQLDDVLALLRPYDGRIEIEFYGHTDSLPVVSIDENIKNNGILSLRRAESGINYAKAKGFSEKRLLLGVTKSVYENSRTLSMKVTFKDRPK